MKVTELELKPYRENYGLGKGELPLFPILKFDRNSPEAIKEWEAFRKFRQALPKTFFTGTWEYYEKELPSPKKYGDGPEGRDALEIVLLLAFTKRIPVLNPGYEWLALDHQAGGICCHHPHFLAHQLNATASCYPALRQIARDRWPKDCGDRFDDQDERPRLIEALRRDLQKIGVDCEQTAEHLDESVYPIDATQNNLDILTENSINLQDLVGDYDIRKYPSNLAIIVLTQNSD